MGTQHPQLVPCPLLPPQSSGEAQTPPTLCSPPGEAEELLPPPRGASCPPPLGGNPCWERGPRGQPGTRGAHRGLPVRVGEDPVDLHVAPVGRCHVDPEPPQARVPRAVGAGHVVAVVVLLQRGGGGTGDGQGLGKHPHFPAVSLLQMKSGRAAALLSLPQVLVPGGASPARPLQQAKILAPVSPPKGPWGAPLAPLGN